MYHVFTKIVTLIIYSNFATNACRLATHTSKISIITGLGSGGGVQIFPRLGVLHIAWIPTRRRT